MKTLDIERILATSIPDIHPAYGGVRGKTMSSCGQGYAWPVIKEAGIDTIIDLRNNGVNQRMMALCEEYGMEYFYYPVDNHADMIRSMVDLFPELCRRIDRGKNGASEFEGEWIQFGNDEFPDWESVVRYLLNNNTYNV